MTMVEFKGTPGPWAYRKHDLSIYAVPANGLPVPQIKKWIGRVNQLDDWHANARLIAAAPDLLEALSEVHALISEGAQTGFNPLEGDWADRLFRSQAKTYRAIAKALGQEAA